LPLNIVRRRTHQRLRKLRILRKRLPHLPQTSKRANFATLAQRGRGRGKGRRSWALRNCQAKGRLSVARVGVHEIDVHEGWLVHVRMIAW
jgi:hypothetical protein